MKRLSTINAYECEPGIIFDKPTFVGVMAWCQQTPSVKNDQVLRLHMV